MRMHHGVLVRPGDVTQIVYFTSEQDARRVQQEPRAEPEELVLRQLCSLDDQLALPSTCATR